MNINDRTIFATALFSIAFLNLYGCKENSKVQLEKPESVPESARYAGGIDGGEWVDCDAPDPGTLICTSFDKNDGIWTSKMSLTFCANYALKKGFKPKLMNADITYFNDMALFRFQPDKFNLESAKYKSLSVEEAEEMALKYYNAYGVTTECQPSSSDSMLQNK